MSFGEQTNPFGSFPGEQRAPQTGGRFNRMLHDPNAQAAARRIAENVGSGAIQGALENTGLVRDDGSIRKIRAARKIATNPMGLARKAATGAVTGARQAGQQEATQAARTVYTNVANQAPAFGSRPNTSPAIDPWGTASTPNGSGFPTAPQAAESSFSNPGFGGSANVAADPFGIAPEQTTSYAQPSQEKSGRSLFGRKREQSTPQPAATAQTDPFVGSSFPVAPTAENAWGLPSTGFQSAPNAYGNGFPSTPNGSAGGFPPSAPVESGFGNPNGGFPPAPAQLPPNPWGI